MTGKEIADNLRATELPWGTRQLYSAKYKTYCVLGIKATEKGVTKETLKLYDFGKCRKSYSNWGLGGLVGVNDVQESKQGLIEKLESKYAVAQYNVEGFVRYLLNVQARRKRRKK